MTKEFKKGILWAKPNSVSALIVKAIDKKKTEVYVPSFWSVVMFIVRLIPIGLFRKLGM